MNEIPQVDAVMVVPEGDAVKTFPLSLDTLCVIAASLSESVENLASNGMVMALAKEGAYSVNEGDEWEKMNDELQSVREKMDKAVREFVSIHNAMHDGENVQVVVVPF